MNKLIANAGRRLLLPTLLGALTACGGSAGVDGTAPEGQPSSSVAAVSSSIGTSSAGVSTSSVSAPSSSLPSSSSRASSSGAGISSASSVSSATSVSSVVGALSSSSTVASSSSSSVPAAVYVPVDIYEYQGINPDNALYVDSDHFRIYYGAEGKLGPKGNLGTHTAAQLNRTLDYLEAAYELFVREKGFRSPGRSVHDRITNAYKLNVYSITDISVGGFMGYDSMAGLSYLVIQSTLLTNPRVTVHEFGHSLTMAERNWIGRTRTGAWWETKAQWVAEVFGQSPHYAEVAARYDHSTAYTLFDPWKVMNQSYLSIIHNTNHYQNWLFFSYLTENPDDIEGLGPDAIRTMIRTLEGQETPIHALDRMTPDVSAQRIMANYHARLAYLDLDNALARQLLVNHKNNTDFWQQAYRDNLVALGNNRYRVSDSKQPMYGGSNFIPLLTEGEAALNIEVINLGNDLPESDLTAIVAIKAGSGGVRYVVLDDGRGIVSVGAGEEATLVVVNTPTQLYLYDAFASSDTDPERRGLNYEVILQGAVPR